MTGTRRRSDEDRKAEMEALHAQLVESVEALRSSEAWTAYLNFAASFHHYSFNNLLLILAQRPEATLVAGYRAWQAKGRQVRKGERGIRILAMSASKSTETDEQTGEETQTVRRRFFPVSVFDVAQTDLMDGHEDPSSVAHDLTGADDLGIFQHVTAYLRSTGVDVSEGSGNGAHGYTQAVTAGEETTLRVVIEARSAPAQKAETALHEAAHITLGHLQDDHAEYLEHRGRYEVEAESVAYVLAGILGLDTSAYSTGYVAGWAQQAEPDVLQSTATRVLAAVHTLADALTDHDDTADAA